MFNKKTAIRVTAIFVGSLGIAIALSLLTFSFPAPRFYDKIGKNIETLSWRSPFNPSVIYGRNFSRLDNHTDAIMTQLSIDNRSQTIIEQAFQPLMVRAYIDEMRGIPNQVMSLEARYYEGEQPNYAYSQYWHGYRLPLRLFGSIFPYAQLRVVNYICMGVLLIISCVMIKRTFDINVMLLYLGSLIAVSIYLVPLSLQYLSVFYILLLGVIALCFFLRKKGGSVPIAEIVVSTAVAVAFFDFLTSPLVVVGILVTLYAIWLYRDRRIGAREVGKRLLSLYALWFGSYILFWALKGVISPLFGVSAVFSDTSAQFTKHISASTAYDWLHAIPHNLATFMGVSSLNASVKGVGYWLYVAAFFLLLALCTLMAMGIAKRQRKVIDRSIVRLYSPLLGIAVSPLLWWQLKAWHSANHYFVYRELAVSIFALGAFFLLTYYRAPVESVPDER